MASIKYLWKCRAKFPFGSKLFFKAWAKRFLLITDIVKRNQRRGRLVWHGATIDKNAEVGAVKLKGPRKNLSIGAFSFVGDVFLTINEQVIIGERVCINDGVRILTGSHDVTDPKWGVIRAKIIIEDFVWIGTNATILPGVTIGKGAVIGAGSVVSKSVERGTIVVGNPARKVEKVRCLELDYNPCELVAANYAWLHG